MSSSRPQPLRVGDRARFEDSVHTVVSISGTLIGLASESGMSCVMHLPHLQASPGFEQLGRGPRVPLQTSAALAALTAAAAERARWWEGHILEVLTGLPPEAPEGTRPRAEYDPSVHTLAEREEAKASELSGSCQDADDQLDVFGLQSVSRAQRHHRNLIARHGRCWALAAFEHAREIFEQWYDKRRPDLKSAFDQRCQQLASTRTRAVSESQVLPVVLHPEIVALTGLLASSYWEHVVFVQPGGSRRYIRELEARGIPAGIILTENDPLIEYLKDQRRAYRFLAQYWRLRGSLFPEETTQHPRPRRPEVNHRLLPVPS